MARQTKTERQRAEEALGVARRKVEHLTKKRDRLEADLKAVKDELRLAQNIRDYRAQNPALPTGDRRPPTAQAGATPEPGTNPEENTAP